MLAINPMEVNTRPQKTQLVSDRQDHVHNLLCNFINNKNNYLKIVKNFKMATAEF